MPRRTKKKKPPQNSLREQAEFAIRITNLDVSILEEDFTKWPSTATYAKAATTTATTSTNNHNKFRLKSHTSYWRINQTYQQ